MFLWFFFNRICGRSDHLTSSFVLKKEWLKKILIFRNGWNCLFYAVLGERLLNIAALLFYQVPIESRDFTGRSPLILSGNFIKLIKESFHALGGQQYNWKIFLVIILLWRAPTNIKTHPLRRLKASSDGKEIKSFIPPQDSRNTLQRIWLWQGTFCSKSFDYKYRV